jgi:hypothetical protein
MTKAKRATSAKPAKSGKVPAKTAGELIPLKRICADLGLDPKRSRVKLRRVWRREETPGVQFHKKNERWDLTPKQAKEVREILET